MALDHKDEALGNAVRAGYEKYIGRAQSTQTPTEAVIERAEGVFLWTVDGKRLTDFAAGVLVANLGHAHPGFESAFARHLGHLPRTGYNMLTQVQLEASRRLIESVAPSSMRKTLWAASGSEAIQKAMWCAMHRRPDCPIILATRGGFHGKKGLANDVTGESSANPNVRWVSFPLDDSQPEAFYEAELDAYAEEYPGKIALLITEPYLGARGSYHPPSWYHKLLQRWCNKNGVVFIFDEVQSCFGRTGEMYAFQKYGVEPDMLVLGKGLANGEPAAAVLGRAELIDALTYGEASDTFSGTPMACAAVCATLDVFESENIVTHARDMGEKMRDALLSLKEKFPFITAVRGEGLVYGVECADGATAQRCVLEAYRGAGKQGVHLLGPLAQKVIRVSPPLVIGDAELEEAVGILESAWARV